MTSQTEITLYGNVGGDPETRTIPGKQVTKQFYDPIIDDMVERDFTTPEREVRTFSITLSEKDLEGNYGNRLPWPPDPLRRLTLHLPPGRIIRSSVTA